MTKLFTHAGIFHADDVFAYCVLKMFFKNIQLERGFAVPKDFEGIVFDIGGGEYDHHEPTEQKKKRVRGAKTPYAAFGKVWRDFGSQMYSAYVVNTIDGMLCEPLDLHDNTGSKDTLSTVIGAFNPDPGSTDDANQLFLDAADLAMSILKRAIAKAQAAESAIETVKEWYENTADSSIVIMPYFLPFQSALAKTKAIFVIYPSNRGGYNAQPVCMEGSDARKMLFPKAWAGKSGKELEEVTGIKGLTFCHAGQFLIAGKTQQSCEDAVRKTLNNK